MCSVKMLAASAITLALVTGVHAGDYPTDTSPMAKALFFNKVAKYEGDDCQKEASTVVAGAQQQLHRDRDTNFPGDELSKADDINEAAIKKMGRKKWCAKTAAELKKAQAEIEKPTGTPATIPETFAYMKKYNLSPNEVCKSALRQDHLAYCLRGGI